MKVNWKQKLTSRKFWTAIASFVALLIVAMGGTQNQAAQITAIIMAGATVAAYIVGEGMIDAAAAGAPNVTADGTTAGQVATAKTDTAPSPESGAVAPDTTGAE